MNNQEPALLSSEEKLLLAMQHDAKMMSWHHHNRGNWTHDELIGLVLLLSDQCNYYKEAISKILAKQKSASSTTAQQLPEELNS